MTPSLNIRPTSVYALMRDDTIIYVGCSVNPKVRLSRHRFDRRDRSLQVRILATYSTRDIALQAEICAIASHRALGLALENKASGGPPRFEMSDEMRRDVARRGAAAELCQRRQSGRNNTASITTADRSAAARRGATPSARKKISEAARSRTHRRDSLGRFA